MRTLSLASWIGVWSKPQWAKIGRKNGTTYALMAAVFFLLIF